MPRGCKESENVHHTVMTPEKRDAISALIGMYDIKSAKDIQEVLKDL